MLRALFLDLDDTLVDRAAAHRTWAEDFLRRHAGRLGPRRPDEALDEMIRADASGDSDRDAYCARVAALVPGAALQTDDVRRDLEQGIVEHTHAFPGIPELLHRWGAVYALRVVTNGWPEIQRGKLGRAGLAPLLRDVFVAGEDGFQKPHPAVFQRALRSVECAPHEVLFVGDHPVNDIAGAAALGLRTCWVTHGKVWPEARRPQPDHVVHQTADLAALLDR